MWSSRQVVKSPEPITFDEDSVIAVNTLGYSGCIGHAILQPYNKVKQPPSDEDKEYPRLVIVSGRTENAAVKAINQVTSAAMNYKSWLVFPLNFCAVSLISANLFSQIIDKPFDPEFIRLTQQAFSRPITGYSSRAMAIIPSDEKGFRPLVASKVTYSILEESLN